MLIRSYSDAFRQDRRIHRGYARHTPNGIPISGVLYAVLLAVFVFVLDHIIITHELLSIVSPFMRLVLLPLGLAFLAFTTRVDGRAAHHALWHVLLMQLRPSRTVNGERIPHDHKSKRERLKLKLRADHDWTRTPRASVTGPAMLRFGQPVRFRLSIRKRWIAHPGGNVHVYPLDSGERLEVKP